LLAHSTLYQQSDMLGEIRPSGVSGRSLAAKNRSGSA
jgi:hypothetical protein